MTGARAVSGAGGAAAVQAAALVLLAVAVTSVLVDGPADPRVAVVFTVLIAVGEAARIGHPGGRERAPLGAAVALAYALLGPLRGLPTAHGALQVVAVCGAGLAGGVLLRFVVPQLRGRSDGEGSVPRPRAGARRAMPPTAPRRRRSPGLLRHRLPAAPGRDAAARRLLSVAFAALLFQPLYNSGALDRLPLAGPAYGVFLTAVAALAALCDAVLAAFQQRARSCLALPCGAGVGRRFGAVLEDELRALPGIGSAIAATGMLVSLTAGEVGLWALPVFCAPLLLAQASFRRAAAIRATYGQTIATLARATEVAGYTAPGHARRVADTACALGRELGLSSRELALLEHAALMHDIGQLSLVEPIPDGATATLPDAEQQRIARLGSEVIRHSGVPAQVAEQVARLADPLRGPDGRTDRTLPLAARIIRVANAHDDLLDRSAPGDRARVLAELKAQSSQAYDPAVVAALARLGPDRTRYSRVVPPGRSRPGGGAGRGRT
ncbi:MULTISPECIES: HD-GYP domain-containing protein [unclassified Kitasatospora]|uniref:HD-GYP domain-containing protein n=1 Tax=unclassified Kitasatospora TaxID=2633591 RepID=UPI0024730263|nr:HD domain-containing phosphohydrolase [Kitasatospora sp. MAP12-44]